MTAPVFSPVALRALRKYGEDVCRIAYHHGVIRGESAHAIAVAYNLPKIATARDAKAAMKAWAEVVREVAYLRARAANDLGL